MPRSSSRAITRRRKSRCRDICSPSAISRIVAVPRPSRTSITAPQVLPRRFITSSSTRVAGACLTCVVPRVTPRRFFGAGGEDQHKRGERKVTPFEPSLVAIWLEWCHFARGSRTRLPALPAAPSLPLRDPGLIHCERVRPRPERASALPGASRSRPRHRGRYTYPSPRWQKEDPQDLIAKRPAYMD